jgi:hypothetical protein
MDKRKESMEWWRSMSFERRFFKTIEWLSDQGRKTDERHPSKLTGREIQEIFEKYSDDN